MLKLILKLLHLEALTTHKLFCSDPPEIEPFSFSANLQEGKRAQVSCSVTSGDMPVHFTWLKDNAPIPSTLQVCCKSLYRIKLRANYFWCLQNKSLSLSISWRSPGCVGGRTRRWFFQQPRIQRSIGAPQRSLYLRGLKYSGQG